MIMEMKSDIEKQLLKMDAKIDLAISTSVNELKEFLKDGMNSIVAKV